MNWIPFAVFIVAVLLVVTGGFASLILAPGAWQCMVGAGFVIIIGQGFYYFGKEAF